MLARLSGSVRARWALVMFFMVAIAAVRAAAPEERDPYWSARAGLDTLAGVPLARPDVWSWSKPDGIWFQNSPGWNVLLGLSWQTAGFWGLFAIAFISISVLLGLGWLLARHLGATPLAGLVGVLFATVIAFPMLSARATVVVQSALLLSVWLGATFSSNLARLNPAVSAVIVGSAGLLLSVAGNWIHLSFVVMAPAIAVMWAVQWTTVRGIGWGRRLLLAAAGGIGLTAGVFATPYGLAETLHQSAATQAACQGLIGEWATILELGPAWWLRSAAAIAILAPAVWWLWRQARSRRWRTDQVRIVAPLLTLAVPASLAGLFSIRFIGVAVLASLPIAAWEASALIRMLLNKARSADSGLLHVLHARGYTEPRMWVVTLTLAAIMFLPFGCFLTAMGARPPEQDLIEQLPNGCKLYATASVAGPTILTRPDVKVWMDGRADYYGRAILIQNYRIMAGAEPVPDGATCVILGTAEHDPAFAGTVATMDANPAWHRVAERNQYIMWLPVRQS